MHIDGKLNSDNSKVEEAKKAIQRLKKCNYKLQCKVINPFKELKQEWSKDYHPIKASTGWHFPNEKLIKSDLSDLGVGVCNYFKLMKFYMILFLIFSLLSKHSLRIKYHIGLPAFIFYASGNKSDMKNVTL